MRLPVDHGWAWVITFACCGLFAFFSGTRKSQGVILVEVMELYPDKSATSLLWIFSLAVLVGQMAGPLNGMFLAKTSTRFVVCFGIILMTCSLIAFGYAPAVEYMYLAYGVCYGFGFGMVQLSLFTAFAPYFDKKRSLSLGLTTSGSGLGMLIIPPILRQLFDNFNFSGAILLHAGFCLQMLLLGVLLRPFSYYERLHRLSQRNDQLDGEPTCTTEEIPDNENFRQRSMSVGANQNDSHLLKDVASGYKSTPNNLHRETTSNTVNIQMSTSQILALSAQDVSFTPQALEAVNSQISDKDYGTEKKRAFKWRLVLAPQCVIVGVAMGMYSSGIRLILPCIPPLGKQAGLTKEFVSILLSSSGVLEIPMRIFHGWFADKKLITKTTHVGLCMCFTGTMSLLCGVIPGTAGLVAGLVGFALSGTSVFSLLPAACSELFGIDNVQTVMAINFVYQGVSQIVATFSGGAIYESTQRWENVFFFITTTTMLGGLIMFFLTCLVRRDEKKREPADGMENNN